MRARRAWLNAFVSLCFVAGLCSSQASDDADELSSRFLQALADWRLGEESVGPELRGIAAELAERFDRGDAPLVAAHYLALTPTERKRGLEREAEFQALRQRARAASEWTGEQLTRWPWERADILAALDRLAESCAGEADYPPAARALSLAARLQLARAERDATLSQADGQALLREVEKRAQRAIELFAAAGQITPQLDPQWILADAARVRGHHTEATRRFLELERQAARVHQRSFREQGRLGLLRLAREAGDPAGVERQLAALARLVTPRESWPLVREHATSLYHLDRPETALTFLMRYRPTVTPDLREWHALCASCLLRLGNHEGAQAQLDALDNEDAPREANIDRELALAGLDLAKGRPAEARRRIYGLAPRDLSPWVRAQAAALEGEAWLAEGRAPAAREALDRALGLADDWRARLEHGPGSVDGEWLGLHTVVLAARARVESGDALAAAQILEHHQSRSLRDQGSVSPVDIVRLAAQAEAGLLTFGVGSDEGLVIYVSPAGTAVAERLPVGRRALATAVRRLREACLEENKARIQSLADELSRTLLPAPIASGLGRAPKGSRLIVLAHGPVESLPLGILPLAGGPLDAHLALSVLPGIPGEHEVRSYVNGEAPWTFIGAPNDHSLAHLPEAEQELAGLAARYPGATLATGDDCRARALLHALATGHSIHVATHLVRDERCADERLAGEALALAHGDRLCAAEISLRAPGPATPLAVLTACSSGGGRFLDGEGLFGVARALLETGVERLSVTLWPVRDGAARRFAESLHDGLEAGLDPSRAAWQARAKLREAGAPARDWAAFRIMGHP